MEIIRKQLKDLAPFGVRYNPTTGEVETLLGETWTASPGADPRKVNVYPPVATAAPRCDSAARIVSATQEVLALVIETMQTAASAFTLVGLLGRVFSFLAPYFGLLLSLFASLATAVIGVGAAALDAQFAAFDWDEFQCKLVDLSEANGQFTQEGFDALMAWIDATYSIEIRLFFHFVYDGLGFAGLNAAAATRSDTGDCSCGYGWGWEWDFTQQSSEGWGAVVAGDGQPRGLFSGMQFQPFPTFPTELRMVAGGFPTARVIRFEFLYSTGNANTNYYLSAGNPTLVLSSSGALAVGTRVWKVLTWTPPLYLGYWTALRLDLVPTSGADSPRIFKIRVFGDDASAPAFTNGTPLS